MRQIWITKFGPPEVLAIRQAPDPEPKPGEARIVNLLTSLGWQIVVRSAGILATCFPSPAPNWWTPPLDPARLDSLLRARASRCVSISMRVRWNSTGPGKEGSILIPNRHLRDVLRAKGYEVGSYAAWLSRCGETRWES